MGNGDISRGTAKYITDPSLLKLVTNVNENVASELIYITDDKAYIFLDAWRRKLENRHSWLGPVSLLISLVSTIVTTEAFKDRLGLTKDQWPAVYYTFTLFSIAWLVYTLYQLVMCRPETVEELVEKLKNAKFPST